MWKLYQYLSYVFEYFSAHRILPFFCGNYINAIFLLKKDINIMFLILRKIVIFLSKKILILVLYLSYVFDILLLIG